MYIKTRLIIGVLLAIFSCVSNAEQIYKGMYLGANISKHEVRNSSLDSLTGGVIRIGYDFDSFWAIEGQFGATITDTYIVTFDGDELGESKVHAEHAGMYVRANWRLVNFTLYGLLGVGYYNLKSEFAANASSPFFESGSDKIEETGFSYGIGVDLFGSNRTALSFNMMQLINEKTDDGFRLKVDAYFLGITHYFNGQRTNHPIH